MDRILIVEDDGHINELLYEALTKEGYDCEQAFSGTEAERLFQENEYALVMLDLMLPGMPGEKVLSSLRKNKKTPVIVLTAKDQLDDKVDLLKSGADDYITKPFSVMIFLSRIKAVLRRSGERDERKNYTYKSITLDDKKHKVFSFNKEVELTFKEYEILKYLILNKGIAVTREQLLNKVWGYDSESESRTVDSHILTLRKKLGESGSLIETIRHVGYKLGD